LQHADTIGVVGAGDKNQHQKKRITNIPPEDSLISGRRRSKFRGGGGGSVLGAGVYVAGHVALGLFEVNLMDLGN
jgi:hypothetical protein